MKPGRAATFFYAAAIALVCPTAKPRLEWLALNRPNWLPFKPALTGRTLRKCQMYDRAVFIEKIHLFSLALAFAAQQSRFLGLQWQLFA